MFQLTVQKKEWNSILLIIKSVIALFFGLQFGKNGTAYLSIAVLTFYLFYTLFGSEITKEFGIYITRRKLKDENINLHTQESKMVFFTFLLGFIGGVALFLMASPLAGLFKRAELLMLFRLLAFVLPISVMSALLIEILATEYNMLVYRILSLVEILVFFVLYFFMKSKLERYGVLVRELLLTEMASAYYGILAILLAVLLTKIIHLIVLFILFLKTGNSKPSGELLDYKKKEVFMPGKIYVRGLSGMLLKFQFCFVAMLFTGRYINKAEDSMSAISNLGKQYGCIMIVAVVIPFMVEFLTVFLQHRTFLAVTREERKVARKNISVCIQYLWIFSIMPAFSILVLKEHIVSLLGESFLDAESFLVKTAFLSIPVLVFVFCMRIWNELQPLIVLCITLVCNLVFSLLLWFRIGNSTKSILLFTGCFLTFLAVIFLILTIREYGIQTEIVSKMLFSSVFAAVLSLLMLGMKIVLTPHMGIKITLCLCLSVGFFLYWILLFSFHILREQDHRVLPIIRLFKREK